MKSTRVEGIEVQQIITVAALEIGNGAEVRSDGSEDGMH